MMRKLLPAIAAAAALGAGIPAAGANPVYWSVNVGVPGVVTTWGNAYAPPPVVVAPPPRVVYYPGYAPSYAPSYGWGYPGPWHRDDDRRWHRWHHWHHDDDD